MNPTQTIERPFCDLLADAIRCNIFTHANIDSLPEDLLATMCKSSILHAILSIESLANCLINSLDLSAKLLEGIEKLRTLDKINIFLKMNGCEELNSGAMPTQAISQLITVRNDYVHPKENKYSDIVSEEKKTLIRDIKNYKVYDLPKDPFR